MAAAVAWRPGFYPPPHQPSPGSSASATPPQGGSDLRTNREHGLHHARESGKEPCAGLKNHSPLEGESARGRSPQSSRWGANAAPRARPVSDYQRQEQRSLGGVLRVLEGYRQVSWRTLCQLNRTSITQASLFSPSPGSTLILGSCASWRSGPSRRRARRPPRRRARPDPPRTAYTRARGLNSVCQKTPLSELSCHDPPHFPRQLQPNFVQEDASDRSGWGDWWWTGPDLRDAAIGRRSRLLGSGFKG